MLAQAIRIHQPREDLHLSTHATWTRRRANIGRNGDGPEVSVPGYYGRPDDSPLRTRTIRVRCILDVGAVDVGAIAREERRANTEIAVRAVCRVFRGSSTLLELAELGGSEIVCGARLINAGGIAAGEEGGSFHDDCMRDDI